MNDAKSQGRLRLRVPIIATLLVGVPIGVRGVLEHKPVNHPSEPDQPRQRSLLPFSATDVTNYFSSVLDKLPVRGQGSAIVFEESKAAEPENRYRVVILREHNDVVITFSAGGDIGMNLAREFFEAPLFKPNETQRLFAMVDHAQGAPTERLHRFTITMRLLASPKNTRLTVRLSP
jgi:hypothetical protein